MNQFKRSVKSVNIPALVALFAILFQNIFPVFMLSPFGNPSGVEARIPGGQVFYQYRHEGLIAGRDPSVDGNWTTGNLCQGGGTCYKELDEVPHRVIISGLTPGTSYSVVMQYDLLKAGVYGYTDFHNFTPILTDIGATGVTIAPSGNVSCGGGVTCNNETIAFTASAAEAYIYYDAVLGKNASEWGGAQLHARMESGIGGENVGNKEVPLPVNKLLALPSITLNKQITDPAGDASPADWCFNISPSVGGRSQYCITGDGDDTSSVSIENLTGTSYTVTESGPSGYSFVSVSGDNCLAGDQSATLTVSPGSPSNDAECTFINQRDTGSLRVVKNVVGPNGEDIVDTSEDFGFTFDLGNGETFTLKDGGDKTFTNIPTGIYTVTENVIPTNYELMSYSSDSDSNTLGAQIAITSGQETVLTVTNNQVGGTLNVHKYTLDQVGSPTTDSSTIFTFQLNGSGNHTIKDDGRVEFNNLLPGLYTVLETGIPSIYTFESYDGDENSSLLGAQVSLANGQEKHVSIYNKQIRTGMLLEKVDNVDPVAAGESFKYTITVLNEGPNVLHDVEILDALPTPFELTAVTTDIGSCTPDLDADDFKCDIGDLSVTQKATITIDVDVPSTADAGKYTNNAMIYAYEYPNGVEVSEETDVRVIYEAGGIATFPPIIYAGDPVELDILGNAYNSGPSVTPQETTYFVSLPKQFVIGTIVTDDNSVNCTIEDKGDYNEISCPLGSMENGDNINFTIPISVNYDVDTQVVTEYIGSWIHFGEWGGGHDGEIQILEKTDLLITKDDGVDQVIAGEGFTYRITVQNGPEALSDADNVVLTDTIPADFIAGSVDNAACQLTGNDLRCEWDHLDPNSPEEVINVDVRSKSSTTPDIYTNSVTVVSDEDEASTTEDTPVINASELELIKSASANPLIAGDGTFEYYVTLRNNGSSDAPGVVFTDYLPSEFVYEGYSITSATNSFTCTVGSPQIPVPSGHYAGRDALNCDIGTMEPAADILLTIVMSVPANTIPGVVINRADLMGQNDDHDFMIDEVTVETDVNLVVEKSDNFADDQSAIAGLDDIIYTIKAENKGLSTARNVKITDALPSDLPFVSVSDTDNCVYEDVSHAVKCDYGNVDGGWMKEIMITVDVPAETPEGIYRNLVILTSEEDKTEAAESTTVTGRSEIDVRKWLRTSNPHVAGQDYVEFRVVYRNLGPSVVTGAYFVDDLSEIFALFDSKDDINVTVNPRNGTCDPVNLDDGTLRCDFGELGIFTDQNRLQGKIDIRIDLPYYIDEGRFRNVVSGYANEADPDRAVRRFDVLEQSDLEIEKTSSPLRVLAGSQENGYVDYEIKVTNNGPSDAENVIVKDILPPVFEMLSMPQLCHYELAESLIPVSIEGNLESLPTITMGMRMECTLPDINPGDSETIQFRMIVPVSAEEGIYTNRVGVISDECLTPNTIIDGDIARFERVEREAISIDMFCDRDMVDVEVYEGSELMMNKKVLSQQPAKAGVDTIKYLVEVWNLGPSDTENVVVRDDLSDLLQHFDSDNEILDINIRPSQGFCTTVDMNSFTFECQLGDMGVYYINGGPQGPRHYATVEIDILLPESTETGTYTNYADAVSDECEQIDEGVCSRAQVDVEVGSAVDLELLKYDNYEEGESAIAGRDEVIYTIELVNNGGPTEGLAYFIDHLPQGFRFVDVTYRETIHIPGDDPNPEIGCAYYPEDHTVRCAFSGLDSSDERVVFDIRVAVEEWVERGIHTNRAEVSYGDDKEESTEETLVSRENQLNLDKEVTSVDGVEIGRDNVLIKSGTKDIVFTTAIYNYGPSIATDVHFTDYISNLLGFVTEGEDLGIRVSVSQGTCDEVDYENEEINCNLGDLPPYNEDDNNEPVYFYLTINIPEYVESGIYNNLVCVSSSETGHEQCQRSIENDTSINYADREWFEIERPEPVVSILKSNSWLATRQDLFLGDVVDFMIELKVEESSIFDLVLSDVIPKGLTYVPSSLEAKLIPPEGINFARPADVETSVTNGIARVLFGDLKKDSTIIVTYQAVVNDEAIPGLIKDISWARGDDIVDNVVLAQSVAGHPSALNDHFVGTEVLIGQVYETEEGEVLGASSTTESSLAATGMSLRSVVEFILVFTAGLVLIVLFAPVSFRETLQKKIRRFDTFLFVVAFVLVGLSMASVSGVEAAGFLRVYEPTATNQNTFNLGYTGATTTSSADVTCMVEAPGGTVTPVGPINHTETAFSGYCSIDSSIIDSDGIYTFWVEGSDEDGVIQPSSKVYFDYDGAPPVSPDPIQVDTVDNCNNTVTINVPGDPDIVKVEIFRSTTPSFGASSTTLIKTLDVSPGETVNYEDTLPSCDLDYYYASRTIDSSNNVSQAIAQSPNTPTAVIVATNEPANLLQNVEAGDVLGEEVDEILDDEAEPVLINTEDEEDRDVEEALETIEENESESNTSENFFKQYWIFLIAGFSLIFVGGYVLNRSRKGDQI